MPLNADRLRGSWALALTSRLLSACRRNRTLLVLALILPGLRLAAIAYGIWLAPPGRFVPLLGDSWGGAQAIQQMKAGRAFPMGDPTNSTASLEVYPPGYFLIVALTSVVTGLDVPFAIQLVGFFIDLLMAFSLYFLSRRFLSRPGAAYALLFLILPGSLVWLRTIPLLLEAGVVSGILEGIASGSAKLALPQAVKDEIALILYGGHLALYDGMRMGYEWLAHSFGLLSLLLFLRWRQAGGKIRLAAAGIMLGLVNLTHPYALFGWDLLFAGGLAYAAGRRLTEAKGLLALLFVALLVSSFYTLPVGYSLLLGGRVRGTLSDVSGELPWGMYNVHGKVRFPGPLRLLEVRGVSITLALLGILLAYRRRQLPRLWLPICLLAFGFFLSPFLVQFGVLNQLLARQEALLFIGSAPLAAYFTVEAVSWLRSRTEASGMGRLVPPAAMLALILLLLAPKVIGFSAYTLRWIPKEDIIDPQRASLIDAIQDLPPQTVYARRDLSRQIGALTHHIVPLGYISTYTTKSWEEMQQSLGDESLVFEENSNWGRMAGVLREEGVKLLVLEPGTSPEKLAIVAEHASNLTLVSGYRLYQLPG